MASARTARVQTQGRPAGWLCRRGEIWHLCKEGTTGVAVSMKRTSALYSLTHTANASLGLLIHLLMPYNVFFYLLAATRLVLKRRPTCGTGFECHSELQVIPAAYWPKLTCDRLVTWKISHTVACVARRPGAGHPLRAGGGRQQLIPFDVGGFAACWGLEKGDLDSDSSGHPPIRWVTRNQGWLEFERYSPVGSPIAH